MPGSMPATSQLEWLSSTTAMIVLFWSRATRDLLRSFGWGIAALHRENAATKLPFPPPPRPIASFGSARDRLSVPREIGFVSRLCRLAADLSRGELRTMTVRRVVPRRIDHRTQFDRIHTFEHGPSQASPALLRRNAAWIGSGGGSA